MSMSWKVPCCQDHGTPCYIKTGIHDGPNKGKSFFICGNPREQCNFALAAKDVPVTYCPIHGLINELQAFRKKDDQLSCHFRCPEGRKARVGWCGFEKVAAHNSIGHVLADISNKWGQKELMSKDHKKGNKMFTLAEVSSHPEQHQEAETTTGQKKTDNQDKGESTLSYSDRKESLDRRNEPECVKDMSSKFGFSKDIDKKQPGDKTSLNPEVLPLKDRLENNATKYPASNVISKINTNIPANSSTDDASGKEVIDLTSPVRDQFVTAGSLLRRRESEKHSSVETSLNPEVLSLKERLEGKASKDPASKFISKTSAHVSTNDAAAAKKNVIGLSKPAPLQLVTAGSLLKARELELKTQLKKKMDLLMRVQPHTLPDGGRKIRLQIEELEQALKALRLGKDETKNIAPAQSSQFRPQPPQFSSDASKHKDMTQFFPKQELASALSGFGDKAGGALQLGFQIPNFGSGTMQYAVPHNQPLYGGRMTHARLQEVGRITRDAIEQLHRSLETCPTPEDECPDPEGLTVTLMPHQRQALAWLLWREKQKPSGGILADDMGLGKTLTMISLVMKDKELGHEVIGSIASDMKYSQGTIIICPASLVHQWYKEIEKRVKALKLRVCMYHGPDREKNIDRLSRFDIVLTTYNIVAMEAKSLIQKDQKDEEKVSSDRLRSKLLGDLRKKFQDSVVAKGFLCSTS